LDVHGLTGRDRFAIDQVFCKALFHDFGNATSPDHGRGGSRRIDPTGAPNATLLYRKQGHSQQDRSVASANIATTDGGNPSQKPYLEILSAMRFDTTFIRNLLAISTAHRLMRAKMSNEMMKIAYPVISGPAITSSKITDSNPWESWDEMRTD